MITRTARHNIQEEQIPESALEIVSRLRESGYEAHLVGGCVRDILLGATPKDFDVATSARPQEIVQLFESSRLVGRRFQIAHVRVSGGFHEVATFRRESVDEDFESQEDEQADDKTEQGTTDARWIEQNLYGTIEQDAFRRDFSINALYYDPMSHEVLDLCDALADVDSGTLRAIGDPEERFLEDPVRMIRAIRIAGRLNLSIEAECEKAISRCRRSILNVSRARLFDELAKLFLCGSAERAYRMLTDFGLTALLFPALHSLDELTLSALESTDSRLAIGKPVTPAFVVAAILWPQFQDALANSSEDVPRFELHSMAAKAVLQEFRETMSLARRHAYFIEDTWMLQHRLEQRHFRRIQRIMMHRRFRAAYDLLVLRSRTDDSLVDVADWWTRIQEVDEVERDSMIRERFPKNSRRSRRNQHRQPLAP
ncbi:MAG: polynucleotide adenylyltransferase PcnB [Pseudomonadales bacterium]|nr:polynucleotide adenylyltransferase PcnB [Pseudomonadales bacterium]